MTDTAEKSNPVLEHIKKLTSTEKQYADRVFPEPPRPKWLDDDEPEEEEPFEEPEVIEEFEEEEIEEEAVEITNQEDINYYSSGLLATLTFGTERALYAINGGDPEDYELDRHQEKHLQRSAAMYFKSKKVKAKPGKWFFFSYIIAYGPKWVDTAINGGKKLFGWFKNRGAKKKAELEEAQKQAAIERQQAEAQAIAEQTQTLEYIKQLEQKLTELSEAQQNQTARTEKTNTAAPVLQKEKLEVPDMSHVKAPTLEQVANMHKNGRCITPGCGKKLTNTKVFCCNAHKVAYQGASQRRTDPFPKVRDVKEFLKTNTNK